MKEYTLKIYQDSVLRDTALFVEEIDKTIRFLIKGMNDLMYNGVLIMDHKPAKDRLKFNFQNQFKEHVD